MFRLFLLFFFTVAFLNAKVTLKEIESKPACHARNFMIWQFLKQDITQKEAKSAYSKISGKNRKVERLYNKKYRVKKSNTKKKKKDGCKKTKNILDIKDDKCFNKAINSYITLYMSNKEREEVAKRVTESWRLKLLKIQSEPYKISAYKKYDSDTVLRMFTNSTKSFRRKHLDMKIDKRFMKRLSKSYKFPSFIKIVMNDNRLKNLQHSLLYADVKYIDEKNNFSLGLYNLQHSHEKKANQHFKEAYKKAKKSSYKDKYLFWSYQSTKDKKYLRKLLKSTNINIYTLYAHEILKKKVHNFYVKTTVSTKKHSVDIRDPFVWYDIQKKIKSTPIKKLFSLAKKYKYKNTIPVYSYILERAYGYHEYGYIMPYDRYMKDINKDEKALVYALMRQESRFIPSALSSSFALGLMQLMPFVVDDLAKKSKEKINYNEMFNPQKNIEYSLKHLKWMKRLYYHPLFSAYAYNGGVGFLRKHLKTGAFRAGKYEPYLSMELMRNSESREYGKRVIANYVMYKKILGQEVSLIDLLKKTLVPKLTDCYRK
jgi:soluble lytic murein transglycosylase